ncbi:hypothetical protein ACVWZV_007208 [Bradyrhizobium sp. GM5.1]
MAGLYAYKNLLAKLNKSYINASEIENDGGSAIPGLALAK